MKPSPGLVYCVVHTHDNGVSIYGFATKKLRDQALKALKKEHQHGIAAELDAVEAGDLKIHGL